MNRKRFYDYFAELTEQEAACKKLYQARPEAFRRAPRDWAEFCSFYLREGEKREDHLPERSPIEMDEWLTEEIYFFKNVTNYSETNVVVNPRYCPPYLHRLEFIKLICVFRGKCSFYYRGKWTELTAGNLCIVAPGVEQTVFSGSDEDVVVNYLMRRSTFTDSFSELLEIRDSGLIAEFFWRMLYRKPGGEVMIFDSRPYRLMEETAIEMFDENCFQPHKNNLVMKSLLKIMYGYIFQRNEKDIIYPEREEGAGVYPLMRYMNYMSRHLDSVSLALLAREFYVSEGYLSRYFRRETGYTFSHILQEMRMKKAAELLVKTQCSMEKIILTVGYRDQSIFFRNFKAMYSMTPMVYRKKKRQAGMLYL